MKQQNVPVNVGKPAALDVTGATKQSDKLKPDKLQADKSQTDKSQTDKSEAEKSKAASDQSTKPPDAASDQSRTAKFDKAAGLTKPSPNPPTNRY